MAGLRKKYITKPERIYADPLHPSTSVYDVVIPQTTSDAVIIEGSQDTLTERLQNLGGVKVEQRNTMIAGDDVVTVSGNTFSVGNYIVSIADGFSNQGVPQDSIYYSTTYTTLTTPTASDRFLLILKNGTFAYAPAFDGGRDFPTENLVTNQVFFHEQLRRAYKYDGSTWVAYPCTAIARFENAQLAEILPYNTWWWDEVVWENHEADIPAGMQVSVYEDTNGDNYLRVRKGGVIDAGHVFTLANDMYKKVQLSFSAGQEGGSNDGNYTNVMTNIVPTSITSSNLQGFSVEGNNVSTVFNALNPSISLVSPRWTSNGIPSYFSISFPEAKSINKYTILSSGETADSVVDSWTLLGSNDGISWDVIDNVSAAGFTAIEESKSFSPTNVKPYSMIKFIVKGTVNPESGYVTLGQIRFYSSVPELNVFVITDDSGNTDVLTSPYSGPTLPVGYTYYHRIGKICIGENANLFGAFPSTSIGIDAAGKYETVMNEVSKKANSSLNNLNSEALKYIATLCAPRMDVDNRTSKSSGVVYQAPVSGYIHVYNTANSTLLYNHNDRAYVNTGTQEALVGGSGAGIPCSMFVAKGSFYKIVSSSATFITFTPAVGSIL